MTNNTQEDTMTRVETALAEWKAASAAVRNIEWGWATWNDTRKAELKASTRLAHAVSEAWPKWSAREAERHAVTTNEGV